MSEKYHKGGVVGDLENGNGLSVIFLWDDGRNHYYFSLLSRIRLQRRHGRSVQSEIMDVLNPYLGKQHMLNFALGIPEWVEWGGYVIAQVWLQPWR